MRLFIHVKRNVSASTQNSGRGGLQHRNQKKSTEPGIVYLTTRQANVLPHQIAGRASCGIRVFIHLKRKVCWLCSNPIFGIACLDTRCCSKTGVTSWRERLSSWPVLVSESARAHSEWQKVRYGERNNQTKI